jgi:predicted component of type VI protein secretion system
MATRNPYVISGSAVWGCLKHLGASSDPYGEDAFFLTKDSVRIGRSADCEISVKCSGVSRRHLVIGIGPGDDRTWIEDVSSNGTTVKNGGRVFLLKKQRAKLEDGDELILCKAGGTSIGFKFKRFHDVEEMLLADRAPPAAAASSSSSAPKRRELANALHFVSVFQSKMILP